MQAIDIFSGAGGMSTGAGLAGIDVCYAVELDRHAATTFSQNHKSTKVIVSDIRKVNGEHFTALNRKRALILFGGPPCQGFSTSNQKNRSLENDSNWLFREYLRIACQIKPDWIVFENVKGLLETENGYFLECVLTGLKRLGYTANHFILNSAEYGVPQRRNRLFIVGSLHGCSVQPPPKLASPEVTVVKALEDLPIIQNGAAIDVQPYSTIARTSYAKRLRGKLKSCSGNLVTQNAPHIIERYSYIPQGGNWEHIPQRLVKNYSDISRCHTGIYHRLKEDEPAVVIGNFRKNMLIHPWEDRGLSVREAARLQSFPDWFQFSGSIGFQQQQVGNAVPPLLAKAVFEQILRNQ